MSSEIHTSRSALTVRFFESEAVVFNRLSSSLHLLSALGAELLLLAEQGTTTQQLINKAIDDYGFDHDQAADFVDQALASYQSLGLLDV